jgi:hypothetical protein
MHINLFKIFKFKQGHPELGHYKGAATTLQKNSDAKKAQNLQLDIKCISLGGVLDSAKDGSTRHAQFLHDLRNRMRLVQLQDLGINFLCSLLPGFGGAGRQTIDSFLDERPTGVFCEGFSSKGFVTISDLNSSAR